MADLPPGDAAAAAPAPGEAQAGGLLGTARRLARTFLSILSTRLELLGVEAAEQGVHIGILLALGAVGLLFAGFALALFSFGIAVLFWDSYRLTAIFGLALVYAVLTAVAVLQVRRRIAAHPAPFAATVAELKADAAALGPH
jgi:uncharacterized membrane protein YqjE